MDVGGRQALLQILIIPGNPGAAGYYVPFMLALRDLFRGRADIVSLSQLGHGYDNGNRVILPLYKSSKAIPPIYLR